MRRMIITATLALLLGAVLASGATGQGEGDDGPYLIRAYFDNAGFLVNDEEVRIAGATVGTVQGVDVTRPGEPVHEDGGDEPGKAVAVLEVTDPGFQDFRTDASCIIRPQSLLGEKFVECKPTQPRSSLSEPPPPLEVIPEGEIGAGQRFLPLENNGKAVDLDLLNNITREPEVDRFRLILNDLGAGLAARGATLNQVLERANPALQQTDKVLAILADQNQQLAQLATDSESVLAPLARERDSIAGFIENATVAGEASAERREDIEHGFVEFPPALAELESTMVELRRFAAAAQPVAADLRVAAPSLAGATEALGPFSSAGTRALTTLGEAAEESESDLIASDPLINDLRKLGEANTAAARNLNGLLNTLRRTGGLDFFYEAIVNLGSAINGFDDFGHFVRSSIQINNCLDITVSPVTGCSAKWTGLNSAATAAAAAAAQPDSPEDIVPSPLADLLGEADTASSDEGGAKEDGRRKKRRQRGGEERDPAPEGAGGAAPEGDGSGVDTRGAEDLFDYLTEDGQ